MRNIWNKIMSFITRIPKKTWIKTGALVIFSALFMTAYTFERQVVLFVTALFGLWFLMYSISDLIDVKFGGEIKAPLKKTPDQDTVVEIGMIAIPKFRAEQITKDGEDVRHYAREMAFKDLSRILKNKYVKYREFKDEFDIFTVECGLVVGEFEKELEDNDD